MIDGVGKGGAGRIDLVAPGEGRRRRRRSTSDGVARPRRRREERRARAGLGRRAGRHAKVEAVRAAIAEGRYPIDPDRIAERMLDARSAPARLMQLAILDTWPVRTRR